MAKKKSKHYPIVRKAELGSVAETAAVRVLDTARALSVLNRRLYRFGRVYSCNIHMDPGAIGNIEVYALRDDWAVQKSFQMAYQVYLDNTMDEREHAMASVARWEDFRVDDGVAAVPASNPLLPRLHDATFAGTTILSAGEFELSNVVDQANTRRSFTWGTPAANEYGILQEYDKAANTQATPADVTGLTGPYADVESDINTLTAADLTADGNNPPYDRNGINATTPWVKIATLGHSAAGAQKLSTGFFNAPCGLVVLVGSSNDWNSSDAHFEVKSGDYKGVHAPSMIEVATVNRKRKVVK